MEGVGGFWVEGGWWVRRVVREVRRVCWRERKGR